MAKFLRYDGGMMDHEDVPAKVRNDSNKPPRAKTVPAPTRRTFEMDPVILHGVKFPKGEAVPLPGGELGDRILKKVQALGCFSVADEAQKTPDAPPTQAAQEGSTNAPNLSRMNKADLLDLAASRHGLELSGELRNADIIAAIEAAEV